MIFFPQELDDLDLDPYASESESEPEEELKGRAKWLKKTVTAPKPLPPKPDRPPATDKPTTDKPTTVDKPTEVPIPKKEHIVPKKTSSAWRDNITAEELDQKVADAVAARGRKGSDHRVKRFLF